MQYGGCYRVLIPQRGKSVSELILDVLSQIGVICWEPRRSNRIHDLGNDIVDSIELVVVLIENGTVGIFIVFHIVQLITNGSYIIDIILSWLPDGRQIVTSCQRRFDQ
jgi:hypothetical protein